MKLELRAVVLDHNPLMGEETLEALGPEIEFIDFAFATNSSEVLTHFMKDSYDLCLITEEQPLKKVGLLVKDLSKLDKSKQCVLIQIRQNLEDYFDKKALTKLGFSTFISREGTDEDKKNLRIVLEEHIRKRKVLERAEEVEKALKVMMPELDQAVEDRRRGIQRPFNTTAHDFIREQFKFDNDVKDLYYEALVKHTENSKPAKAMRLEIPDEILEKDLPNLSRDTYNGISRRVWERLVKKHGHVLEDEESSEGEEPAQEPAGSE